MNIVKTAGIAIIAVAISVIIKQIKPEYSIFIPITCATVLFIYAVSEFGGLIEEAARKAEQYGLENAYIKVLIKCLGIAYVTETATDVCRDAGENAIASKTELCGKIMILTCCMPVMFSVLEMIDEVLTLI
ncbi:MAG: hypothetical protein IJO93_01720 [Clostridia bacterium]|nr:hypothetical protein [Clostridia bacterium]